MEIPNLNISFADNNNNNPTTSTLQLQTTMFLNSVSSFLPIWQLNWQKGEFLTILKIISVWEDSIQKSQHTTKDNHFSPEFIPKDFNNVKKLWKNTAIDPKIGNYLLRKENWANLTCYNAFLKENTIAFPDNSKFSIFDNIILDQQANNNDLNEPEISIKIERIPNAIFDTISSELKSKSKFLKEVKNQAEITVGVKECEKDETISRINDIISANKHILKNEEICVNFPQTTTDENNPGLEKFKKNNVSIRACVCKGFKIINLLISDEEKFCPHEIDPLPGRFVGKQLVKFEILSKDNKVITNVEDLPKESKADEGLFLDSILFANPDEEIDKSDEIECPVCYDTLISKTEETIEKVPYVLLCGHVYCKECLKMHIKYCVDNFKFPIICPKCGECLSLKEIQDILDRTDGEMIYEKLIKNAIVLQLRQNPEKYVLCPKCESVVKYVDDIEKRVVHCNNCHKDYCMLCRAEEHVGKVLLCFLSSFILFFIFCS